MAGERELLPLIKPLLCADGSLRLNFRRVPMGRGFSLERYALGVYNEICQALRDSVEE